MKFAFTASHLLVFILWFLSQCLLSAFSVCPLGSARICLQPLSQFCCAHLYTAHHSTSTLFGSRPRTQCIKKSVFPRVVFHTRGCCGQANPKCLELPRASLFPTLLHSLPYPLVIDGMCGLFRPGGLRQERHLRQPTATSQSMIS